jgi:EAL domain-containing protein (putative c-di-GMP-specific phosphodiesterase class I)
MRQFKLTNLLDSIGKILERTGLDPGSLEVELTESIIMQNPETTVATLRELSAMGIYLSIDDFGTGYSSLNYLKYLPINKLKIAPNFAAGIGKDANDEAICKAIITLAHSLNLKVIAEGVETPEQLEFFRAHDCDEVQGYLFSKPLSARELSTLFAEECWHDTPHDAQDNPKETTLQD